MTRLPFAFNGCNPCRGSKDELVSVAGTELPAGGSEFNLAYDDIQ